jgi:hypothetical protein
MKAKILFFTFSFFLTVKLMAQVYNPVCFSNAEGWKITQIENSSGSTVVHLQYYSYKPNYQFWINSGMYIENTASSYGRKCYISSFVDNALNTMYKLEPYTDYNFVLKFEQVPSSWTTVNIVEPPTSGYEAWYWKNLSLISSSPTRLRPHKFMETNGLDFVKQCTHPLSTFKRMDYSVDYNKIRVTVYYASNVTDLEIKFNIDGIYDTKVVYDSQLFNPFSVFAVIRDWIISEVKPEDRKLVDQMISNLSGKDLATLALNIMWNLE